MKAALTWTSGFPKMEVMIGIESSSICLKYRFKNKFLGSTYLIELKFREIICVVRLF
jgi:hypothetical protein